MSKNDASRPRGADPGPAQGTIVELASPISTARPAVKIKPRRCFLCGEPTGRIIFQYQWQGWITVCSTCAADHDAIQAALQQAWQNFLIRRVEQQRIRAIVGASGD